MKYKTFGLFEAIMTPLLLAVCFACGGGYDVVNAPPVTIYISPTTVRVESGKSTTLTVTKRGTDVVWPTLADGEGSYTINGNQVVYTAPVVTEDTVVRFTVAATANPSNTATARITVFVVENVEQQGRVLHTDGEPISGVTVTAGTVNVTTDVLGGFSFRTAKFVDDRAIVKFKKEGYFTVTRSGLMEKDIFLEAVMFGKGESTITKKISFNASDPATIEVPTGLIVHLPASSMMSANGFAYSGNVTADTLYLDPDDENFASMMPGGDLAAVRDDGSNTMLISWGMINLSLTDYAGNPLLIKNGSSAELTFPIPTGMKDNPPAIILLWHFDDTRCVWVESGVVTLLGDVYVGQVEHSSWINLGVPTERVTIRGRVVDVKGRPVPHTRVKTGQT